ncbi:murein hydrolase activator EnvC family protein [Luteipulveratus mongoliensis]|uniref:M23ase beta-sheet core domain-containing protein n=1 Tax=Luteipulveratus mongoliensis TaxID=571913 RepID=A0A0K1JI60_9MICO|nr:M23 family metallopeptidase [Luteipulveratus mongoliensis]AKU16407.1 hypothetical protein VV02_11935 [Luteipulveratus mongoliensis]
MDATLIAALLAAATAVLSVGSSSIAGSSAAPGRPAPAHGYVWPLDPQPEVVRAFEPPPLPWSPGHRGVDLRGHPGQVVRSAGAGRVVYSGVIAGRGVVSVEHSGGWRTTYEPLDSRVNVGTTLAAGSTIGHLATSGSHCAPGACLHWGLLTAPDTYRDPLQLLGARRPVLLPLG